jgi:hypothetical protein
MHRLLRSLLLGLALLPAGSGSAQAVADSLTLDRWVVVDLKQWAWYLNFTHEQKEAVRAIDASYAEREAQLDPSADYVLVETEAYCTQRRALVAACTEEVRAALDPARFQRWLNLRNGAKPVKPPPRGSMIRMGPVRW